MYYTVHSRTSMAWIRKIVGLSLLVLLAAILMRKVPFDPDTLKNERVVVCGASSGIGEGIAYYYSKFGAKVFLAARRWKELERVKRKCKKLGAGDAQYVAVDLGLDAGILTLVKVCLYFFDWTVSYFEHHRLNSLLVWTLSLMKTWHLIWAICWPHRIVSTTPLINCSC